MDVMQLHHLRGCGMALTTTKPYRLHITVYGLPAPQGSKRHVGRGIMVESSKHLAPWREDVKQAALRALEEHPEWERDYPYVTARMVFTLPRPRVHYRTGKFAHLLRDGAPRLHAVKPDLDKLVRSTGDALTTAGVYADDCRLAAVYALKTYPTAPGNPQAMDRPGALITLTGVRQ